MLQPLNPLDFIRELVGQKDMCIGRPGRKKPKEKLLIQIYMPLFMLVIKKGLRATFKQAKHPTHKARASLSYIYYQPSHKERAFYWKGKVNRRW
jgi:hypothetical protein